MYIQTFTFPCAIKQVGPSTIEVAMQPLQHETFTEDQREHVIRNMGIREGERFLEEQERAIHRAMFIACIK